MSKVVRCHEDISEASDIKGFHVGISVAVVPLFGGFIVAFIPFIVVVVSIPVVPVFFHEFIFCAAIIDL